MEAIDLLTTRRSVKARDLGLPGPDPEELTRILEAGIRVPDHGKIGPWRIQIVTAEGKALLADLFARLFRAEHGARATERMLEAERERPARSPVLLVVTAHLHIPHKVPEFEQRLSGGAVCMNILNAAHALGYGAQWLTEWPAFHVEVKRALGHAPETDILGFIHIGTPSAAPQPRARPDLDTVVTVWPRPTS